MDDNFIWVNFNRQRVYFLYLFKSFWNNMIQCYSTTAARERILEKRKKKKKTPSVSTLKYKNEEEGFMKEGEEILTPEEEKAIKEKLEYYGYI